MSKPNVILCQCDQLRAFEVGCYGNTVIRTPHIDRLAGRGARFDLAVTNNPVCTPARSCLLTGQYSRTCAGTVDNVFLDPPAQERSRLKDTTIAEVFKQAGYDTALIGKWHVWGHPNLVGFDDTVYPCTPHRHYGQRYFENLDAEGFVVDQFGPDFEISRVRQYLRAHAGDAAKPFFLHYNISPPHPPIGPGNAPDWYADMYRPQDVPLRDNVFDDGTMAHDEKWFKIYTIWDYFTRWLEHPTDRLPPDTTLRHLIAWYYGMATMVDDMVGRMMASLDELGMADNTLVVFNSDHGDNLGSHQLFNKNCLYEESIRVPLMFHFPGAIQSRTCAAQIARTIDIMPTVLDLCGLPVPSSVQGRSLKAILDGDAETLEDNVAFIETDPTFFGRPCIGIRTPTHLYAMKLTKDWRRIEDDRFWFFDLRDDPLQVKNLNESGQQQDVAAELSERLQLWNRETPWLEVAMPRRKKRTGEFWLSDDE